MSDSRSCGRCIYYNSIINECGEESKCMRDVDEAKYTSYIAGKKQGKLDGVRELAEWLAEVSKVSEPIKEYTINRWLEDFAEWQKERQKNG